MSTRPVIVFDSGLGGYSIYRPLKTALPQENIIYLSDPVHFPYGHRSSAWITQRFRQLAVDFRALDPKLVVLACNTATVNVITVLRKSLPCPVVGVEPVIKPLSAYPHSLALMTESSARSPQTRQLLNKYGDHVQIYTPVGLAEAIEYNDYAQVKKILGQLKRYLSRHPVTAIGLSCTHYPLILGEFKHLFPNITFLDPSAAVVREVIRVLRLSQ